MDSSSQVIPAKGINLNEEGFKNLHQLLEERYPAHVHQVASQYPEDENAELTMDIAQGGVASSGASSLHLSTDLSQDGSTTSVSSSPQLYTFFVTQYGWAWHIED